MLNSGFIEVEAIATNIRLAIVFVSTKIKKMFHVSTSFLSSSCLVSFASTGLCGS